MDGRHIAIMQPYFFPYVGYWQLLAMADVFVVYDDGLFRKKGWIHHNRILGYDGKSAMPIAIPIRDMSCNRRINETERIYDPEQVAKMLKGMEIRYRRAPHCAAVMELVRTLMGNPETNVAKFLTDCLRGVMGYLKIDTPLVISSTIDKTGLDNVLDKAERICKTVGILDYVNPSGGMEIYAQEDFRARGLTLQFLCRDPELRYRQFGDGFVPDLSIIDVMMFNTPEEVGALLRRYTLC